MWYYLSLVGRGSCLDLLSPFGQHWKEPRLGLYSIEHWGFLNRFMALLHYCHGELVISETWGLLSYFQCYRCCYNSVLNRALLLSSGIFKYVCPVAKCGGIRLPLKLSFFWSTPIWTYPDRTTSKTTKLVDNWLCSWTRPPCPSVPILICFSPPQFIFSDKMCNLT